ncbi:hypothetical protein CNR22_03080 [Sphingobacteriaceae bacterium]|nr:hypothetical protein CNR22_03080 [Sphingobacteriaceae bacterium]
MLKTKYIKIASASFLLLIALWMATPKVYVNTFLHPLQSGASLDTDTKVKSHSSTEESLGKYDNKPSSYFNVFKFVFSFIPSKGK